jgi:hypothetical protein
MFEIKFITALDIVQQKIHKLPFTQCNNIKLRRLLGRIDDRRIMVRFPSWKITFFLSTAYKARSPIEALLVIPSPRIAATKILTRISVSLFSHICHISGSFIPLVTFLLLFVGGGWGEKFLQLHFMHLCPSSFGILHFKIKYVPH